MQQTKKDNGINIFLQFGFKQIKESGDNAQGSCPFCEDSEHFFINIESQNKLWDCKKCGRSGGFKSFVEQIIDLSINNFKGKAANFLSADRGIPLKALTNASIGFHRMSNQYIIPVFGIDNKTILNAKLFDFESFRNCAGFSSVWYGVSDKILECKNIFICEGEWDTIVMRHVICALEMNDSFAIGTPGASMFKSDIIPMLSSKNITLLYDNDEAGENGTKKAIKNLENIANKINFLKWPEGYKKGYDIRDLFKDNNKNVNDFILFINEHLQQAETQQKINVPSEKEIDTQLHHEEVYKTFRKWLHIPNTDILDIIYGTILANRLPGDPLWMFLVAVSGGMKTEPINSISDCQEVYTISTLTSKSLISGSNFGQGADPSLIPLLDGRVLVVKDFTAILSMNVTEQQEIFGMLRDAYDGESKKRFGNGIERHYRSKFGILAAVTPKIQQFVEGNTSLGERFLRWHNFIPHNTTKRLEYVSKAIDNEGKEDQMREELREVGRSILGFKGYKVPAFTDVFKKKLMALAEVIAHLRGAVYRDQYTKDIMHGADVELGTRLAKQLMKLLRGVCMFKGTEEITNEHYKMAIQVAKSSVTEKKYNAVHAIIKYRDKEEITLSTISKHVKLPVNTCNLLMGDLESLRIVKKVENGNSPAFEITKNFEKILDISGILSTIQEEV